MRTLCLYISLLIMPFLSITGCNTVEDDTYISPTIISGIVRDNIGSGIGFAKVSLPTALDFSAVFTNENGTFYLTGFPPGKHRLKVEKIGFEVFETDVPKPVNGTSTVNPRLTRTSYNVPAVKPVSIGPVRIMNKKLETDYDGDGTYTEWTVKGAAFAPTPIGGKPTTKTVYDRSVTWLKGMNANTVRTYSGVDKYFLQQAAANNIRVIVSFWVDLGADLSVSATRQDFIDRFTVMIYDLKDSPGILMWNIGNEQNYSSSPNNGNSPFWYSLVQEMAVAAYKIEGLQYHPVCISNGNHYNIGNAAMNANDTSLTYVDLWASNAYEQNFAPFFSTYRTKSAKPIVITEFGIDALDNSTKTEYESMQAYFDSTNWIQLRTANDVCVGGTVFEFSDEWWKAGDQNSHDYGGYPTGAHPDGYSNEEWWGVIAVTPDIDGDGLDEWRGRKAYYTFQQLWK